MRFTGQVGTLSRLRLGVLHPRLGKVGPLYFVVSYVCDEIFFGLLVYTSPIRMPWRLGRTAGDTCHQGPRWTGCGRRVSCDGREG